MTQRRLTRAEQRVATRTAILDAAGRCLVEDGYAALTTRRVAERAEVAQSTLMHHFPTREALLVEAVTAPRAARSPTTRSTRSTSPALRDARAARGGARPASGGEFTSPQALAAAQLWFAAWTEPELAAALRDLEERLTGCSSRPRARSCPSRRPRDFPALVDTGLSLIRGLVMAIPVSGREAVEARWQPVRPVLAACGGRRADSLDDADGQRAA